MKYFNILLLNLILIVLNLILDKFNYIFINLIFVIYVLYLNSINLVKDEKITCQMPTKENPFMNYDNNVKKLPACLSNNIYDVIDKNLNKDIFKTMYNQKNNSNYYFSSFYTTPSNTHFKDFIGVYEYDEPSDLKNLISYKMIN